MVIALSNRIETTILSNLFFREEYTRKVLPFLKADYFSQRTEQILFGEVVTCKVDSQDRVECFKPQCLTRLRDSTIKIILNCPNTPDFNIIEMVFCDMK